MYVKQYLGHGTSRWAEAVRWMREAGGEAMGVGEHSSAAYIVGTNAHLYLFHYQRYNNPRLPPLPALGGGRFLFSRYRHIYVYMLPQAQTKQMWCTARSNMHNKGCLDCTFPTNNFVRDEVFSPPTRRSLMSNTPYKSRGIRHGGGG